MKKKHRLNSWDGSIPWTRNGLIEALEIGEMVPDPDEAMHAVLERLAERGVGTVDAESHCYGWMVVERFLFQHRERLEHDKLFFATGIDLRLLDLLATMKYTRLPPGRPGEEGVDTFDIEWLVKEALSKAYFGD